MQVDLFGYKFQGPFYIGKGGIPTTPGIYVIVRQTPGKQLEYLDVGVADNVRDRIATHERRPCWNKHCHPYNQQYLYLYEEGYLPNIRANKEKEIREKLDPPCGER